MIQFNILIHFILTYFIIVSAQSNNSDNQNVNDTRFCKKSTPLTLNLTLTMLESYEVNTRKFCWKPPFRCTKPELQTRTVTRHRIVTHIKQEDVCCSGYVGNGTICEPVCSKGCLNGKCIKPEKCQCFDGYVGRNCEICLKCGSACPEGSYGPNCEQKCKCYNNAICDSKSGNCTCTAGWRDEDCNTPCQKGYFGLNCLQKCDANQTVCDHVIGKDICRDGYMGLYCEKSCPEGRYGNNCTKFCTCKNDAICNIENGTCNCKPGWKGENCDISCETGTYGIKCEQKCLCSSGSICSPLDGQCRCAPGYKGLYCTEQCSYGYYGDHCATPCKCEGENSICDPVEGCICPAGFTGEKCDVNVNDKIERLVDSTTHIESNHTTLYVVIGILLVIILIIIGSGIFWYRKMIAKQKSIQDVLNVRYTANSFADVTEDRPQNDYQIQTDHQNRNPQLGNSSKLNEPMYLEPLLKNATANLTNPNMSPARYENMDRNSTEKDSIYEEIDVQ